MEKKWEKQMINPMKKTTHKYIYKCWNKNKTHTQKKIKTKKQKTKNKKKMNKQLKTKIPEALGKPQLDELAHCCLLLLSYYRAPPIEYWREAPIYPSVACWIIIMFTPFSVPTKNANYPIPNGPILYLVLPSAFLFPESYITGNLFLLLFPLWYRCSFVLQTQNCPNTCLIQWWSLYK